MPHQITPTRTSHKVAVIGAGAAGLVAARELRREGHHVTVFERSNRVGGIWVYDPATESDPLGIHPSRTTVHGSLYASLRTNLPREIMGFRDYPFIAKHEKHRDPRRFPCHQEVLYYLNDFMTEFGLSELIRFDTEVVNVQWIEEKKWIVRSKRIDKEGEEDEEIYNAVVVCVGHNSKPNVADIPGIDGWPGEQIHSHNYRVPDPYSKKVVVLIGGASSAYDISREIASVAKEVHVVSRSNTNKIPTKQIGYDNFWHHSMIKSAHKDGTVVFEDGSSILVDVILHCTGYKYDYPFLHCDDIGTVDDNCVGSLYQHIFPPVVAPWLAFIGIPYKISPFPVFETQSKWVAGILSERISLPTQSHMISDVEAFYEKLKSDGIPKRYTHQMGYSQSEYMDWLAAQCGYPPLEEWRKEMFLSLNVSRESKAGISEDYRDEWGDQDLFMRAHKDFLQYISPSNISTQDS